jgi:hypothetical protein
MSAVLILPLPRLVTARHNDLMGVHLHCEGELTPGRSDI